MIKIKSQFYAELREIIEEQNTVKFRLLHYFYFLSFFFYIFRLCLILYYINNPTASGQKFISQFDCLYHILVAFNYKADTFFVLFFVLLFLDGARLEWLLHFKPVESNSAWTILYDVAVVNTKLFLECQVGRSEKALIFQNEFGKVLRQMPAKQVLPQLVVHFLAKKFAYFSIWRKSAYLNQECFLKNRLPNFPHFGGALRIKLAKLVILSDTFHLYSIIMFC